MSAIWRKIPLLIVMVALLTGCGAEATGTPAPASNTALTQVALQVEVLSKELERIGPTLTVMSKAFVVEPTTVMVTEVVQNTHSPILRPETSPPPSETIQASSSVSVPTVTVPVGATAVEAVPTVQNTAIVANTMAVQSTVAIQKTASPPVVSDGNLAIPSPTPYSPKEEILLEDDFSGQIGWFTEKSDRYTLNFQDDGYRMLVITKNSPIWSVRSKEFDDVRLETDVTQLDGPTDGYFGLVCRQMDAENYYMLVVSRDGTFGIGKVKNRELRYLNFANQYVDSIHPAGNRLRADCVGSDLKLFVDGQLVLQASDSDFPDGGVGLVVGNRSAPGTDVLFDNFLVIKP